VQKMIDGGDPFYVKFLSIFARSASAVTPSEKSLINTSRKSTTRFPTSPRWTSSGLHCVMSL